VHVLDRADIETARGRGDDERARLAGELAADHDLLEVAAREVAGLRLRPRRLDRIAGDQRGGALEDAGAPQERPGAHVGVAVGLEDDVRGDREARRDSRPQPVLGHVRDAVGNCVARVARAQRDARDRHVSGRQRPQPGERLGELALAVAGDAGDADDLAAAHRERDAAQRGQTAVALGVQVVGLEYHLPRRPGARLATVLLDLAPDHQRRQGLGGRARRRRGRDDAPAAQHRDAVGDLEHLVQLVRDEDDRAAVGGHGAQRREQRVRLLRGQHRRRLVEDQDARVAVERLEDLDALLLAHRQLPDARTRVDGQTELVCEPGHLAFQRGAVGHEPPVMLVAERDVLGDRDRLHEPEVLVHHPDSALQGVAGRAQCHRLAVQLERALIRPVQARDDVGQRALAGAVLASSACTSRA